MRSKIILVGLLLFPLFGVAVTLEETVKEVINTNPIIQERIKYFRAVKQDIKIAESGYYPSLDFIASYGREKSNNSNTLSNDKYLNREEVGIVFSQNLFEGMATKNDVDRQYSKVDSAAFSVLEQANQVSLSMIEAYINLLKEKALLALAEENIETQKSINAKIKDRINSGVGASSELEQSNSRLALAQSNYYAQMNNYQDSISSFNRVYGKMVSIEDLEEPQSIEIPYENQDEALMAARTKNPSLKVQMSNIKVAKSSYDITKSSFYPRVDLVARADWNDNVSGVDIDSDSSSIMLNLQYNLYNGGSDISAKQKSISQMHQEMQVYNDLVRRVEESVRLSWMAYSVLEKQIGFLQEHQGMSEKTLASYEEEFDLGRRTLLDILDTKEEVYSANRELTNAKYDYILAKYRILEATDNILSAMDSDFVNVVGFGDAEDSQADVEDVMLEAMN